MCGQRTKVKTAHFPGHKVLLVREITGIPKAWGLVPFLDVPQFSINRFDVLRIF